MKHALIMILCILLLSVGTVLPLAAAAPDLVDDGELLTADERAALREAVQRANSATGCTFSVVTVQGRDADDTRQGERFLREYGLSESDHLVLLVIMEQGGEYYYNLYLYGDGFRRITSDEAQELLDASDVFYPIKSGRISEGVSAFLQHAADAYNNRSVVKSPYLSALPVALVIAVVIAVASCLLVKRHYSVKHRSVDYPLDHFARLELTEQSDQFIGSFVTTRVISSEHGHGRGGSGHRGGRSSSGGRGFAGGR